MESWPQNSEFRNNPESFNHIIYEPTNKTKDMNKTFVNL